MIKPVHILNQLGVLTSFAVSKPLSEKEVYNYCPRKHRRGKSKAQISKIIEERIIAEMEDAIRNNKIPGLLDMSEDTSAANLGEDIVKNIPELSRFLSLIVANLSKRKYSKMALCYFINNLVNLLCLSEDDFLKFAKLQPDSDNDDDTDEFEND